MASSYPNMVLIEALNNRVPEEIIIRIEVLPSAPTPIHILLLPSKALIIVCQTQNQLHPISPCLRYHKIQTLSITAKLTKQIPVSQKKKLERERERLREGERGT